MEYIIRADNLTRRFGKQIAVDQLNLRLARGEVLALLGTNGAGKTTALRLLVGELTPHQGSVLFNDIDLHTKPLKAKKLLGYLPDIPPLYQDLTIDEYLHYCAQLHQVPKQAIAERVTKVKRYCELNQVGRKLIKKLSKGYQQRVGIAQAIIHEPAAIILDEPTNGLDPSQILEMRDLILDLKSQAGVLLSTHQLNEVEEICDRVQILKQGRSIFEKDMHELKNTKYICMRFLQSPPVNLLESNPNIQKIISCGENTIKISTTAELDQIKLELLTYAQINAWQLAEIYDTHDSLENIFATEILRN
jgi:ABC-2 type transport system ATP-binding protein